MLENAANNAHVIQQLLLNLSKVMENMDQDLEGIAKKTNDIVDAEQRLNTLKSKTQENYQAQKDYLDKINKALAETEKTEQNIVWIRQLEREKTQVLSSLDRAEGNRNYSQDITSSINSLGGIVDKLTNGIEKFLNFQTRIQTMQMDQIKMGWENISSGQTPYLTKTLGIMTDYSKASLENQTASNNALITTVGTTLAAIAGGIVGGVTTGGVGVGVGSMLAAGIANQVLDGIFTMAERKGKEELFRTQKDTALFGNFKEFQSELRNIRMGIGTYLSNKGVSFSNYLSGEGLTEVENVEQKMRDINKEFAGIPGFDMADQNKLMMMMGMSKQFNSQSNIGNADFGKNVNIMSQMTGLGSQEILQYMTEMRIRFNTPLDQLVGQFSQLVDISDKLQMPLKQVMGDLMEMNKGNQRYKFSQNEIIGLYAVFSDEIKKGTVSVGDLQKFIKGLSDTPMDKVIGMGALINSVDRESVLKNVKGGDRNTINQMMDALSGSGEDAGLLLKLISQPDAIKSPLMQNFMESQGIDQNQLKSWQTQLPKMLLGVSSSLAENSGSGGYAIKQYMFEQFANMLGTPLSSNLYDQGQTLKGYEKLGTTGNFSGDNVNMNFENTAKRLKDVHDRMIASQITELEKLIPSVDKFNSSLQEGKGIFESYKIVIDNVRTWSEDVAKSMKKHLEIAGIVPTSDPNQPPLTLRQRKEQTVNDMLGKDNPMSVVINLNNRMWDTFGDASGINAAVQMLFKALKNK